MIVKSVIIFLMYRALFGRRVMILYRPC